jgi:Phosphoenolpyruvate synthase/pyruvate phosphate dikinase
MTPAYTKTFRDISGHDVLSVGGKGALLGELTQYDIPVPPGFVVCTHAFTRFLNANGLLDLPEKGFMSLCQENVSAKRLSHELTELIQSSVMPADIAAEIQEQYAILSAALVAVRSSATAEDNAEHSWAGQLESYLNVSAGQLLDSVKKCWASLFSERALTYRLHETSGHEPVQVAVVVQEMINPEVAGIAFSVDPVAEDRDKMIIEAGFGLGEAVVQGQITPDHYVVEKHSFSIFDKFLSPQIRGIYYLKDGSTGWKGLDPGITSRQKLEDPDISKLGKMVAAIEQLVGFPCDIEWVYDNRQFYIVQCRPITTLS